MKRLPLMVLLASLALTGCRTASHRAKATDDFSIGEMRTMVIQQMRDAGATPAQIREMERQLDAMERDVNQVQQQLNHIDKAYQ